MACLTLARRVVLEVLDIRDDTRRERRGNVETARIWSVLQVPRVQRAARPRIKGWTTARARPTATRRKAGNQIN